MLEQQQHAPARSDGQPELEVRRPALEVIVSGGGHGGVRARFPYLLSPGERLSSRGLASYGLEASPELQGPLRDASQETDLLIR